jgi:hypothetical protein
VRLHAIRTARLAEIINDEPGTVGPGSKARCTTSASTGSEEVAWKMAQDQLPATLNEDGTVDGTRIGEVVNAVVKQCPFLIQQEPEEAPPAGCAPRARCTTTASTTP